MFERIRIARPDRVFVILSFLLIVWNLTLQLFTPLDLSPDEAHYWTWSQKLDLAYYSKGPLIAYILYCSEKIFGHSQLAVRLPALIFFMAFSLTFFLFIRKFYDSSIALLIWAMLCSAPLFAQTGLIMTTDPPTAFFWLIAIAAAYYCIIEDFPWCWVLFGVVLGLGVLAKYTVFILYPSLIVFLLLTPSHRGQLRSWQFVLGSFVFLLIISPILIWNFQHNWVNFSHNAGHVARVSKIGFTPEFLLELLLGQLGLLGPITFTILIAGLWTGYKMWRKGDLASGFFLFTSAPMLLFVVLVSLTKRVYPNWPLPLYIGASLLLAHLLARHKFLNGQGSRYLLWGAVSSLLITVFAQLLFLGFTFGLPASLLPTRKLVGWKTSTQEVARLLDSFGREDNRNLFILTDDYDVASEISFYLQRPIRVMCANLSWRRMNQYDIWGGWESLKGQDAIVILKSKDRAMEVSNKFKTFRTMKALPIQQTEFAGEIVRQSFIYLGRGYDGSPTTPPVRY